MFRACEVKMAKMAAHSAENGARKQPEKKVTVKERKPRIGTDWRTSRMGMRTSSARRLLAASVA